MRISDWSSDVCSSDLEPPDLVEDRTAGIDCVDDEYEHQVEQISAEDVRKGHGVVPEMHGRHDGADFRKGGRDTEQHGPDKTCPDSGLPGDCVTGSGEHVAGDQNDDGGEYSAEDDPAESRRSEEHTSALQSLMSTSMTD